MMKDMTGKQFGKLTVISLDHKDKRQECYWLCRCECGNEKVVSGNKLRSGNTKSCGCYQEEVRGKYRVTHGMTNSKLYVIWSNMKSRCYNKKNNMFYRYGGRGIEVAPEWRNSFENFSVWAIQSGYKEGLSIERVDIDKGYNPENCRWITKKEQYLNRSDSHMITAFGKTQTIKEWADQNGIPYDTIERRINAYGWEPERAVSEKVRGA